MTPQSMFRGFLPVAVTLSLAWIHVSHAQEYVRMCYYTSWSWYRSGVGKYSSSDTDPFLCTHVIYSFYLFDDGQFTLRPDDSWAQSNNIGGLLNLRTVNPNLKLLIAVGGYNMGSSGWSNMVRSAANRNTFVTSVVNTLISLDFDGLDLDWEYPGMRGGADVDRQNYVTMCQELRAAFTSSGRNFLLTAAVPAGRQNIMNAQGQSAYRGAEQYLDFYNVMAYDYHGTWESVTGHNAPLYPTAGSFSELTVQGTLDIYEQELGVPRSKLVMGMATYGHMWRLTGTATTPGSPGSVGPPTQYLQQGGSITYYEVCLLYSSGTRVWDSDSQVPYVVVSNQNLWISYDDVQSLAVKTDVVKNEGYAGVMFWALDEDEFNNQCGGGRFTLINSVKARLQGETTSAITTTTTTPPPTTTTTTSATTTTTTPTTSNPTTTTATTTTTTPNTGTGDCTQYYIYTGPELFGFAADPGNCGRYYWFVFGMRLFFPMPCAPGTLFNINIRRCDHSWRVNCQCSTRT